MKLAMMKALATFIFATTGVLVGVPILDADVELWKLAVGTGLGAVLNFAYRASEAFLASHPD